MQPFIPMQTQLEMGFWISKGGDINLPRLTKTDHLEKALNNFIKEAENQYLSYCKQILNMRPEEWIETQPLIKAMRGELDRRATVPPTEETKE